MITFLSLEIATYINMHAPLLLLRIIIIIIITTIIIIIRSSSSSARKTRWGWKYDKYRGVVGRLQGLAGEI